MSYLSLVLLIALSLDDGFYKVYVLYFVLDCLQHIMYRTVDTEANSIIGSDNPSFARPVEVEPIQLELSWVFLLLLCLLSMSHVLNSTGFSLWLGWELVFSMFCFSLKTSL